MILACLVLPVLCGECIGAEQGGDDAVKLVLEILKSGDQEMQSVAIGMVKEMQGSDITRALAKELANLSATSQVQLLAALGDRGDPEALPAVIAATRSKDAAVRIAALKAAGQLGDKSTVMVLAERAASARGDEQKAAQESLYRLRGEGVDSAILAGIEKAEPATKVELIKALEQRNVVTGVDILLKTATDTDRKVRAASFKVLGALAGPERLGALVELLIGLKSAPDRTQAEKMVAAVAHKIERKDKQAEAVLARLGTVKDVGSRSSLLSVLGRIGDSSALPAIRRELASEETEIRTAAIRALSGWPSAEPLSDLVKLASESKSQLHRILALRGFVRLLGLASGRPAAETVAMYKQAMALAPNSMEKRRVLSGLSATPSADALEMAVGYLGDRELVAEAAVAVIKIAQSLGQQDRAKGIEALEKVVSSVGNESLVNSARDALEKLKAKDN